MGFHSILMVPMCVCMYVWLFRYHPFYIERDIRNGDIKPKKPDSNGDHGSKFKYIWARIQTTVTQLNAHESNIMELQMWSSNKLEDNHLTFQNLPETEPHFLELTSEIFLLEWMKNQLDAEFWFLSIASGKCWIIPRKKREGWNISKSVLL